MKNYSDIQLSLENISKSYLNDGSILNVFTDLSFNIKKGEFLAVLGPSGCGKSTLLKICSSLIMQDTGKVSISGFEVSKSDRNRILMLQDDNQLFPWLTVEKNVAFSIKNSVLHKSELNITKLLEVSGLKGYSNYYPHQLSGGMKKRTALARALAGKPEILLMDEPFGSLDAKIKIKLQKFLLEVWAKYKMTILFVTHDIHEAINISERIIVFNSIGNIISDEAVSGSRDSSISKEVHFELYKKYYTLLTDLEED